MKKLLWLFTVLLAFRAASSDEGARTTRSGNYTRRRELTSQDDLDGVYALTNSFEQLNKYSGGDPCDILSPWPWVICSVYPTRVAFLYLSGYGLRGNLPDFSKLDGLQAIYMSDNELDGPIPDFLGKLPHLYLLDLSDNKFSGKVPKSITSNANLSYDLSGNPDLNLSQPKKKKGLIIGLVVGIPAAIIVVVLVIAFIVYSRRSQKLQLQLQQQQQQQVMTSSHGQSSIDIGSMGRPSNSGDHLSSAVGDNAPTAPMFNGSPNQAGGANANAAQNADSDEIAELLRQRTGQTG